MSQILYPRRSTCDHIAREAHQTNGRSIVRAKSYQPAHPAWRPGSRRRPRRGRAKNRESRSGLNSGRSRAPPAASSAVLEILIRAIGHASGQHLPGLFGFGKPRITAQRLAGREQPVIGEDFLQLGHHRTLHAEMDVLHRVWVALRQCPTRIFMPPVNPTRPSATRIFRCVRRFIDIRCHKANAGRNRAYLTPSRRRVAE